MSKMFERICKMKAARECFDSGMAVDRIARQTKASPATVRRWLKTTGLRTTRRA